MNCFDFESLYVYQIYSGATVTRIAVRFTQAVTKIANFAVIPVQLLSNYDLTNS